MRVARIALEFGLGDAGRLEIELIEERRLGLRHHGRRPRRAARQERHAQGGDGAKAVGPKRARNARRPARPSRGRRRRPVARRARRARRPCRRRDETACTGRSPRAGRSGHSRACRARRRDSRPRRAPSADGATNTRIPESRGRGARAVPRRPRRDGCGIPFASTVRWAISATRSSSVECRSAEFGASLEHAAGPAPSLRRRRTALQIEPRLSRLKQRSPSQLPSASAKAASRPTRSPPSMPTSPRASATASPPPRRSAASTATR